MTTNPADPLDQVFLALADPTRRAILERLSDGDAAVSDLATPFSISAPAISRHLKVLENAGLVKRRVAAQQRIISLDGAALKRASDWVDRYRTFWEGSLDRLDVLLTGARQAATHNTRRKTARGKT